MQLQFILRDLIEDDKSFIFNSFLKSYKTSTPIKYTPDTLYFKPQSKIIEQLINNSNILVAVFPEEPTQILAYIIYEDTDEAFIIHYIYVKNMFRWKNFASSIIKQLNNKSLIIATHVSDDFDKLKYKIQGARIVYDPFLIQKRMK